VALAPLAGGVSCDVWRAEVGPTAFAVKRALPQLRTAAHWTAPVERAESEVRWLQRAGAVVPTAVPRVLAHDPARHLFAMNYLEPADHPVWKDELIAGRVSPAFAGEVGAVLAAIHAATAVDPLIGQEFQTGELFHALRIDPFLLHVARQDDEVAPRLRQLAADLGSTRIALVHGDVSPKNILVGPSGPVLLDAECAVYGDPAFDAAFCLTHLLLKAVWLTDHAAALMDSARAFAARYRAGIDWEDAAGLERRTAALVAALLLARVDGKSPATYLNEANRSHVRASARHALLAPDLTLTALLDDWPRIP
jgi:5-methylthioribose kinase